MKRSFYYDDLGVATVLMSHGLGVRSMMDVLARIYETDRLLLEPEYQDDKKAFFAAVLYWTDYLADRVQLDDEFPAVQRELASISETTDEVWTDDYDVELFFLNVRLRILYLDAQDFVRIKMKTLLAKYGYKRRSRQLMERLQECMDVYQIRAYLKGGKPCDLWDVRLDDMISFRVV